MAEIGAELESQGLVDREAFMEQAADAELSTSLGIPALNVEGYLFPDTYYFSRGMSAQAIIRKMVDRFREVFGQVKALGEQKTRLTDFQTVILASLVEAETNADQERALVAGVFVARLKKKMLLQCDPTVIYGLENFNGNITKEDLADPHPYNTYVHPGLPPGPIGNPGRASLEAALYPGRHQTPLLCLQERRDPPFFRDLLQAPGRGAEIPAVTGPGPCGIIRTRRNIMDNNRRLK